MSIPKSRRLTVEHLICDGLGYCCQFAFFSLHRQTGLIAARLGVCERAIRYHKMAFKHGDMECQHLKTCLKEKLKF